MRIKRTPESLAAELTFLHPTLRLVNCQLTDRRSKVEILCPVHGKFSKTVEAIIYKKQGCPECNKPSGTKIGRVTRDILIERLQKHYGDSVTVPDSLKTLKSGEYITLTCTLHGDYRVIASRAMRGLQGCPVCSRITLREKLRIPIESFKLVLKENHGDTLRVKSGTYVDLSSRVTLLCEQHGEVSATAHSIYYSKAGCRKCSTAKRVQREREVCSAAFTSAVKEIYRDTLDFSKTRYINYRQRLIVECREHGPFETTPNRLLVTREGCPFCSGLYTCPHALHERLKDVHGNHYSFDLIDSTKNKVGVTCNVCGDRWYAWFYNLLNGQQVCKTCHPSDTRGFKIDKPGFVYVLEFTGLPVPVFKVGITNLLPEARVVSMGVDPQVSVKILKTVGFKRGADALAKEREILYFYRAYKYVGEKFTRSGYTEMLTVEPVIP